MLSAWKTGKTSCTAIQTALERCSLNGEGCSGRSCTRPCAGRWVGSIDIVANSCHLVRSREGTFFSSIERCLLRLGCSTARPNGAVCCLSADSESGTFLSLFHQQAFALAAARSAIARWRSLSPGLKEPESAFYPHPLVCPCFCWSNFPEASPHAGVVCHGHQPNRHSWRIENQHSCWR